MRRIYCRIEFGVTKKRSAPPCVFCGSTEAPSTEHVVPRWARRALGIASAVKEYSGTTYVGSAETLAITFHEVCRL